MVHSIELLFDADTEATLRRIWDDLSAADLPSRIPAGRPHVTLAVAERIEPDVDALLRPVAQRLPLGCTIGAPLLFGQSSAILARLIVPSADLEIAGTAFYSDRYTKTGGSWRIAHTGYTRVFEEHRVHSTFAALSFTSRFAP